jgi:1-acyl-sn-glycerol-3-phosphate acyltransferase
MNKEQRAYRIAYIFVIFLLRLFFRVKPIGRENIPQGPAIVCSNHSNWADPFIIANAFTKEHQIRVMAKAELFKIPLLRGFLRSIGTFPVKRGKSDVSAIRTTLRYLQEGYKVVIFPEGTRVTDEDATAAKNGAVRLAERAGVPIVPIYIPRKKRLFFHFPLVIGKPYHINQDKAKLSTEEYDALAEELMQKIKELRPLGKIRGNGEASA